MNIINLLLKSVLLSSIISSITGLPISTELGPAIVVRQNKQIIFSPENETIIEPIKAIVSPPPPPAPPGPIFIKNNDEITSTKFITFDGIIIHTPKDASLFILPVEQ